MQLIYAGTIERSIRKVNLPKELSLSANPKRSNEEQSLKLLQDIIIPYMRK